MQAGRKGLDNLSSIGATEAISPEAKELLKAHAKAAGQKNIEFPAKAVFTIKPDKHTVRVVACGNKTAETYGRTSTTDLDTAMLTFLLSWVLRLLTLPLYFWM